MSTNILDRETYRSTYGKATHDSGNTSERARRRDQRALARSVDGYTAQAVHLARAYDHAIGWALTYGIKVYTVTEHGVHLRALGSLRDDIQAHEAPILAAQEEARRRAEIDERIRQAFAEIDERVGKTPALRM